MEAQSEKKVDVADVAVVGLGPGGLAAALELASSGKKVIAFTNRSNYTRGQRLALLPATKSFLDRYRTAGDKEDDKFFESMSKGQGSRCAN